MELDATISIDFIWNDLGDAVVLPQPNCQQFVVSGSYEKKKRFSFPNSHSYPVHSVSMQDIADSAYNFRKGRPQLIPSFSKLVADVLFSLVVQVLFLVQSMVVRLLPINYVGVILCFVHLCLLYSLYSFEYKWFNMGWELHKRLTYIETNWPYFIGFGMPLAILTQIPNSQVVR